MHNPIRDSVNRYEVVGYLLRGDPLGVTRRGVPQAPQKTRLHYILGHRPARRLVGSCGP